jgi:hypothetical protein
MQSNNGLVKFRLKLSDTELKLLKLISIDEEKHQYEVAADAISWASERRDAILPIAYQIESKFRTCYVPVEDADLSMLEDCWSCRTNVALYTAIALYVRFKHRLMRGELNYETCDSPAQASSFS